MTKTSTVTLPPAVYDVKAKLHTIKRHGKLYLSLYITFKLRRAVTSGAHALRHGHVVSVAKPRHFAGHSGLLILTLNRKHWPTKRKVLHVTGRLRHISAGASGLHVCAWPAIREPVSHAANHGPDTMRSQTTIVLRRAAPQRRRTPAGAGCFREGAPAVRGSPLPRSCSCWRRRRAQSGRRQAALRPSQRSNPGRERPRRSKAKAPRPRRSAPKPQAPLSASAPGSQATPLHVDPSGINLDRVAVPIAAVVPGAEPPVVSQRRRSRPARPAFAARGNTGPATRADRRRHRGDAGIAEPGLEPSTPPPSPSALLGSSAAIAGTARCSTSFSTPTEHPRSCCRSTWRPPQRYGVPWEVLAAINEVESDYGFDLGASSAGAEGWMQFLPEEWLAYGVDANGAGVRDPYNPADAIFAAARYLAAAGAAHEPARRDLRLQPLLELRRIGDPAQPADRGDAAVADQQSHRDRQRTLPGGRWRTAHGNGGLERVARNPPPRARQQAAHSSATGAPAPPPAAGRRGEHERAGPTWRARASPPTPGAPVVAVQNAEVIRTGHDATLGHFIELRDAYGDIYTYAQLGRVLKRYALPQQRPRDRVCSTPMVQPAGARTARATAHGHMGCGRHGDRQRARSAHPGRRCTSCSRSARRAPGRSIPARCFRAGSCSAKPRASPRKAHSRCSAPTPAMR